jgi:hypothetical protein
VNAITWVHVGAGRAAILVGTIAAAVRKGGTAHARAGTWFTVAMIVLAVSGIIPAALKPDIDVALTASGVIMAYFVATSWMAARRRVGGAGTPERCACAVILALAAAFGWCAIAGARSAEGLFAGAPWPLHLGLSALCAVAGILDLRFILSGLSGRQRIARHLWRMCFAFLLTTSFFFLGQQDEMPRPVRGSPVLVVLALAPLAVMIFWLAKLRFGRALAALRPRARLPGSSSAS